MEEESSSSPPPEDESSSSPPPEDESSSSLPPQDESSSSLPPQDESSSSLPPQDESSSSLPPQDESSSSPPPVDETSSSLPPQDESETLKPPISTCIPSGFRRMVNFEDSPLTADDIVNDRVQLFLLRAPAQLEMRRLHKMYIEPSSQVSYTDDGQERSFDVRLHRREMQLKNSVLLLPSEDKSSLQAVAARLDGCLDLTLAVDLPDQEHYLPRASEVTLPDGLTQRFVPFGSVSAPYNPDDPHVTSLRKLKKKKKRKSRDSAQLGEFISLDALSSQETPSKKRKRVEPAANRVSWKEPAANRVSWKEPLAEESTNQEPPRKKKKSRSSIGGLDTSSQDLDSSPGNVRYYQSPQVRSTASYDIFQELESIPYDQQLLQYEVKSER